MGRLRMFAVCFLNCMQIFMVISGVGILFVVLNATGARFFEVVCYSRALQFEVAMVFLGFLLFLVRRTLGDKAWFVIGFFVFFAVIFLGRFV